MALLSNNCLLLVDPKGDHDMHIDVPLVGTQTILDVVDAVRTGIRLDATKNTTKIPASRPVTRLIGS